MSSTTSRDAIIPMEGLHRDSRIFGLSRFTVGAVAEKARQNKRTSMRSEAGALMDSRLP